MFLSFILLLLCIIARHQRSNRRLCEKRNLTDLVKLIAAIAVVVCHLFTFYMHNPAWAAGKSIWKPFRFYLLFSVRLRINVQL